MLNEHTMTKLAEMKLEGMVNSYQEQLSDPEYVTMSFEERFAQLVDTQWLTQQNRDLERRLNYAKLRIPACMENINWQHRRGLDREMLNALAMPDWIRYHQNCLITGPTGVGKSYLACAIAQKACRNGYRALYFNAQKLFREILAARATGTLTRMLRRFSRIQLLIIDDFGLEVTDNILYRDFLEIVEDRTQKGAIIITSQYPLDSWHEIIGDQTVADAILDRIIHNSYQIQLEGESMRKVLNKNRAKHK